MFVFNFIYTKVLALIYSTIVKYNVVNNKIIKNWHIKRDEEEDDV